MKDRIKKLRKMLDLTQQEFSDRIGIKRNTIATYESGRNEPIDAVVSLICKEFNVSEKWLRTGEGEMFVPAPSSELDALMGRYGLTSGERILIERFINLKQDERSVIINFIMGTATELAKSALQEKSAKFHDEVDIEAEVADYRRILELQKKATAELSALSGINGTDGKIV